MNFEYILALILMCALFVIGVYLMKYIRRIWLADFIFSAVIYISYICMSIYIYKTDTDPGRWNFLNTLPVANVSPFMFSIIPIILILPKKLKKHFHLLISLLSVGMFLSTVLGCIGNAARNYNFHFHFMLDYLSHFALSAYGIFLIRSKQVKLSFKNFVISSSILFGVATTMLILNVIFDTSFFGLSLNGNHNIYNMVLVDNSYLSALIYYLGMAVVLLSGAMVCKLFSTKHFKIKSCFA